MPDNNITLKRIGIHKWAMFAALGHQMGPDFRGSRYKAIEWANAWVSSFKDWKVVMEHEPKCKFDPSPMKGTALGMFHCPECYEMVTAGFPHPNYGDTTDDEES